VPNRYIVVLKDNMPAAAQVDTAEVARELTLQHGGKLLHTYQSALRGFAVEMSETQVRELLAEPRVAYIEEDSLVEAIGTQTGATWGLDRVDQTHLPLNNTYSYNTDGRGVHAYIIDTGVLTTHNEFSHRIGNGYDAVNPGGSATDCNGHGTHVAGTVGGTTYGVAKQVIIHPVRVLGCSGSGTNAGVIAGVDWVKHNHLKPAVANMSLGGGASQALDTAVTNAISAGVVFAVAAGNDSGDACAKSPARTPNAITVGSTTRTDARSSFSNYGTCLDLFAPGSDITSAWHTSNSATHTISGTSMAAPHVAGAAALYLAAHSSASPQQVRDALVNNGSAGRVGNPGPGSPNVLLYTGFIGGCQVSEQQLLHPGFEGGYAGWTTSPEVINGTTEGSAPHSGDYKAWLNGYGRVRNDYAFQDVFIPASACSAHLRFWVKITTREFLPYHYDTLAVQIRDTADAVRATLGTYSNLNESDDYLETSFELSAYKGQTVRIYFNGNEDKAYETSFFLDDVTLEIIR
jgi:subtilisin family serine protease